MINLQKIPNLPHALGSLFFPHLCPGCNSELQSHKETICPKCISQLPETDFACQAGNPVDMLFWGRVRVEAATSRYYFTSGSRLQKILHALKYEQNTEAGILLGRLLGRSIKDSARFEDIESIVPMPLHPKKEKTRGYNQADMIARGISEIIGKPVCRKLVRRQKNTSSQTKKNRMDRWKNVEHGFAVQIQDLAQKNILLCDDVLTTGATLESCAKALQDAGCSRLYISTVAYASR